MENKYPPYTITDKMLNYVSDIMKNHQIKNINWQSSDRVATEITFKLKELNKGTYQWKRNYHLDQNY